MVGFTSSAITGLIIVLLLVAAVAIAWLVIDNSQRKKLIAERASTLVMLEVRVPKESGKKEDEQLKDYRAYVAIMDQLLSSFASYYESGFNASWKGQPVFSFEIIAKDEEIIFFVGVPRSLQESVERQILSYYPAAQIEPSEDFKVFDTSLKASVGVLDLSKLFIYPLRTYTELEIDPLSNITNSLSRLGANSKAIVQVLLRPQSGSWRSTVGSAINDLRAGRSVSSSNMFWARLLDTATRQVSEISKSTQGKSADTPKPSEEMKGPTPLQQAQMELIQKKGEKTGFDTQIRILALETTAELAKESVRNIFSSFAQFGSPDRNNLKISFPSLKKILPYVVLRYFTPRNIMILNTEEIATLFHLPSFLIDTPGIRWFLAKRAPAPVNIPQEGLLLGENVYRGQVKPIKIKLDDRRRHLYSIGMTGTGKSTFFESMALQDIREGRGVGFFDPHGDAIDGILKKMPASRANDVVVFSPAERERVMGLNLLEWKTPEQKDFLVQEAVQIFYKLFDPHGQGIVGPQFEHWMRNAALTLMEAEGGGTLIEIPQLFVDDAFRNEKIAQVKDPTVRAFWEKQLAKTADFHKSEMYNYFISKFGRFMSNDMMRNIIGQKKSSFDLREIMDNRKILLVNLSKGQVGEVNSNLLGMILIAKLFTAALSRQGTKNEERQDFYLYVDEFQNFATDTFSAILSEARKYRLNLSITNQYIAQLPEPIRDAIIGNVGTMVTFRIGVPDAEFMEHEFSPVFNAKDLNNIEAYNCYVKLLIDNTPSQPFSMRTIKDTTEDDPRKAEAIKELSGLRFGYAKSNVAQPVALPPSTTEATMAQTSELEAR